MPSCASRRSPIWRLKRRDSLVLLDGTCVPLLNLLSGLACKCEERGREKRRCAPCLACSHTVLFYLTILYGTVLYSASHRDFDRTLLKVICVPCYVLAILLPCLVGWKSKHDDKTN